MNYYKTKYHTNKKKALDILGGICVSCGTKEKLTFDHINRDRAEKKFIISQMFTGSWHRIEEELKKCQLLCVSCHAHKSIKERGWGEPKHGTLTRYMRLKCKCDDCKEAGRLNNRKHYEIRMGYS